MDLPQAAEHLKALEQRFPDRKIVPISAQSNEGIEALKGSLQELVLQERSEVSGRRDETWGRGSRKSPGHHQGNQRIH
jgi:selenocysteine-specific translation elongation factor